MKNNEIKMYKIDANKNIAICEDTIEWAKFFETQNRRVARTTYAGFEISTVFLALDHNFGETNDQRPILFETIVFDKFGREIPKFTKRYCTWDEAENGHKKTESVVKNSTIKFWGESLWMLLKRAFSL